MGFPVTPFFHPIELFPVLENLFRKNSKDLSKIESTGDVFKIDSGNSSLLISFLVILALLFVVALFSIEVNSTKTVQGIVSSAKVSTVVYSNESSVITEIFVKPGQIVKAGERLIKTSIKPIGINNIGSHFKSINALEKQVENNSKILESIQRKNQVEINRLKKEKKSIKNKIEKINEQIYFTNKIIELSGERLRKIQVLLDVGGVSTLQVSNEEENLISTKLAGSKLQEELVQLNFELDRVESSIKEEKESFLEKKLSTENAIETLNNEIIKTKESSVTTLYSPVSGSITSTFVAQGQYVSENSRLLEVSPIKNEFTISFFIPTHQSLEVSKGQRVEFQVENISESIENSFKGNVLRVSNSIIDSSQNMFPIEIEEPSFKVDVSINLENSQSNLSLLKNGVPVKGNVVVERKNLLRWLLDNNS